MLQEQNKGLDRFFQIKLSTAIKYSLPWKLVNQSWVVDKFLIILREAGYVADWRRNNLSLQIHLPRSKTKQEWKQFIHAVLRFPEPKWNPTFVSLTNSDDQTSIYNYGVAANIKEYNITINFSKLIIPKFMMKSKGRGEVFSLSLTPWFLSLVCTQDQW